SHYHLVARCATADDVRRSGVRGSGRSDGIWTGPPRPLPARSRLRRQDSTWGQTRRSTGRTADQVRFGYQPGRSAGARPDRATYAARPRRRGDRVNRREFITLLGGAAAAWPLAARAQQPSKIYRVGLLVNGAPMGATDKRRQTLRSVLAAHGFVDGQNLVFVQRSADARPERLDGLVAELKAANVDVIVTFG